jgi:Tfp pilus assembly protein FimT
VAERGTSVAEALVALAIASLVVLIAVPGLRYVIRGTTLRAAARQAVGDLREARAEAIATGWECRIVGYGTGSSHPNRNQYRVMARKTSAVAWPADTSAILKTSSQKVGPWVDITTAFPGVELDPGGSSADDRFEILFDSRGAATASPTDLSPLRVVGEGKPASISVSAAGGITLQ